jgi:hypothetical protein
VDDPTVTKARRPADGATRVTDPERHEPLPPVKRWLELVYGNDIVQRAEPSP